MQVSYNPSVWQAVWGSVERTEQHLLEAGWRQTSAVFSDFLRNTETPLALEDDRPPMDTDVNEISVEEQHAYRHNMSRWKRDVFKAVRLDPEPFWNIMSIVHDARAPLRHFMNFMAKPLPEHELVAAGAHLAQLACGRGEQFFEDFGVLLQAPASAVEGLTAFAVQMVLGHAAGFARRILGALRKLTRRMDA